ncbi:MAG: metX [Planctomycetaceae bacterium]|nr:metX [Planctomycetaceae bacterium]
MSIVDPAAAPSMRQPDSDSFAELDAAPQPASGVHDPRSVGIVETKYLTLFEPPNPLVLANQATLGPITVAYETYGTLNHAKDNAIFVCHALTGDAHMAGRRSSDDRKAGWWDELVGPGKGLDTNRYFIICANVLGGCQGTTGPGNIDPSTGERFGLKFPFITFGDIVAVHSELVRKLGIDKLLAVIGGSVGGMQVLEWAAKFPDQLRAAICLASGPRLSAQGIAFNMVGRRAITSDPNFAQGNYYGDGKGSIINIETGPKLGLALARMVAHITYLSEESIEQKFGRNLQHREQFTYDMSTEVEFKVESYLNYQGQRFVERFDANSYLYLTRAMDYFDLNRDHGELSKALSRTNARFLVVSYTSDWLFTTAQSKQVVAALVKEQKHVTFVELESPFGHDSFLLEVEPLQEMLEPFLSQTHLSAQTR